LLLAGGWLGCFYYHRPVALAQTAHALQPQKDGSIIAAKNTTPVPTTPPLMTPAGEHVVAEGHISLSPQRRPATGPLAATEPARQSGVAGGGQPAPAANAGPCAPVDLDYALLANKAGQEDFQVKAEGAVIKDVTFDTLAPVMPVKAHPWGLGLALPLGLPGAGRWGLAGAYEFQALPVTVGVSSFTVQGRLAGVGSVLWRF